MAQLGIGQNGKRFVVLFEIAPLSVSYQCNGNVTVPPQQPQGAADHWTIYSK